MMKSKTKIRHGITITEALASIGVAAVGLFGVLAVIPFAARQAEVGLDLDYAVAAGKNAFHDFEARGMNDRSLWRIGFAETAGNVVDFNPLSLTSINLRPSQRVELAWGNQVVVIDPLFLKENADLSNTELSLDHFPLGNFLTGDNDPDDLDELDGVDDPSIGKSSLTVRRINVASRTNARDDLFQSTASLLDDPLAYNFAQAINVFQHPDDLSFDDPEDKLLLPSQAYKLIDPTQSNQNVANRLKRQASGKISWMAMMVPENGNSFLYRAYMVAFKNRQLRFELNDVDGNGDGNTTREIVGEKIYDAQLATGGQGIGGGEFILTYSSGTFRDNKSLRAGDWVLLTDNNTNYRWYRISRINDANAPANLQVTLTGPNWDANSTNVQAIALSGVVAVFEKTIPIENDSIWNQ